MYSWEFNLVVHLVLIRQVFKQLRILRYIMSDPVTTYNSFLNSIAFMVMILTRNAMNAILHALLVLGLKQIIVRNALLGIF